MPICRVAGCGRKTTGHSRYCNGHKTRARRHGDARQETITKTILEPAARAVGAWVDQRGGSSAWARLEAPWRSLAGSAGDFLCEREAGRTASRNEHRAWLDIATVAESVPPRVVVETVAGMVLLREREPRRFVSDQAFLVQLARRFRGLTDRHAGSYWHPGLNRVKRVYRDAPPAASVILGKLLMQTLGVIGLSVHRAQEEAAQVTEDERAALAAALEEMTRGGHEAQA